MLALAKLRVERWRIIRLLLITGTFRTGERPTDSSVGRYWSDVFRRERRGFELVESDFDERIAMSIPAPRGPSVGR